MPKYPKSVSDFQRWLARKVQQLDAARGQHDEGSDRDEGAHPDEGDYRDAAEIVKDAGLFARSLGAAELASRCRRKSPMLTIDEATAHLRDCLNWCERSASNTKLMTPPHVARMLGVSPEKVRELIEAGELKAINSADPRRTRPRYKIAPEALADFQKLRSATPAPKPQRRRRQSDSAVTRYSSRLAANRAHG